MSDMWNISKKKDEMVLIQNIADMISKMKKQYVHEQNMPFDEFTQLIESTFSNFVTEYPTLYKLVMESDNLEPLELIISSINNVCDGHEKLDDVRNNIGEYLGDIYVRSKLGEPPKSDDSNNKKNKKK